MKQHLSVIYEENMKNHACAVLTNGHHTDIALTVYSNRIFLIVTHYKKVGTLVSVNHQSSLTQFKSNVFATKVIFGNDDIQIVAAARHIAEAIDIDRPLLISLALKDYNPDTIKTIVAAVKKFKTW